PDGQRLATASWDKTVRVWDLEGNQLALLKGHQDSVNSVSFSPDGQRLATASWDKTVRVWDLEGNQLALLKGHQDSVNSVSFSPNGKTLATASDDKTVRVWDLEGNQLALLKGHQDSVNSVSFSPDGKTLATASSDHTARLWAVEDLDEMLARGCKLLENYFVENFQALESLSSCQDSVNKAAVAPGLVKQGEKLAKEGKLIKALSLYKEAQQLDLNLKIDANYWNNLCWDGSLHGYAVEVMDACEKAVAKEPENGFFKRSRGLAKALTGDKAGAISDFQVYVDSTDNDEWKAQPQKWIDDLRAGKNPFTEEVLKDLLEE
ncbi:MAG: WD40 repeat domain-containing protein, partial [Moorea sp. SIO4E2]